MTVQLPWPYVPGEQTPDSFEERIQQNMDALAIAVGSLNQYSPWITIGATGAPAFTNGWANNTGAFGSAGYWKDNNGVVHFRGVLTAAGATTNAAFTLPTGFRPLNTRRFPSQYWNGSAEVPGLCEITSAGVVNLYSTGDSFTTGQTFQLLDHISFRAEA